MRFSSKVFCRKFNQFRKQNWSAPTIMSVFIAICMLCIFSLETIGLLNTSRNLPYRMGAPEISIKINSDEKKSLETNLLNLEDGSAAINESIILQQIQHNKKVAIQDLLYDAAYNQYTYESMEASSSDNDKDNELRFSDI